MKTHYQQSIHELNQRNNLLISLIQSRNQSRYVNYRQRVWLWYLEDCKMCCLMQFPQHFIEMGHICRYVIFSLVLRRKRMMAGTWCCHSPNKSLYNHRLPSFVVTNTNNSQCQLAREYCITTRSHNQIIVY